MMLLIYLALGLAMLAWLMVAMTAIRLWRLRSEDFTGWDLTWDGMAWFRADTFRPSAAATHVLFLRWFAVFFVALFAAAGLSALAHL